MGWEMVCKECGKAFVFDDAEQERYARDGFAPPKRCRACRAARRAASRPVEPAPAPVKDAAAPTSYEAQCGACGALTRVPFEPTDVRPVYCQVCFEYR